MAEHLPCFLLVSSQPLPATENTPREKLAMQADLSDVLSRELSPEDLRGLKEAALKTLFLSKSDTDRSWFTCAMLVALVKSRKLEVSPEESAKVFGFLASIDPGSAAISWHAAYSYALLTKKLVNSSIPATLILAALEKVFLHTNASKSSERKTPFLVEAVILSACRKALLLSACPVEVEMLSACMRILKALPAKPITEELEDSELLGEGWPMHRMMLRKAVNLSVIIALNDVPERTFSSTLRSLPFLQGSPVDICIDDDKDIVRLLSGVFGEWHKLELSGSSTPPLFNPFVLFARFLRLVLFDPEVIHDLIVETKGTFLEFLIKFLRVCTRRPELITEELKEEDGALSLFIQVLQRLKDSDFDFNANPLIQRIDKLLKVIR